jgi:hypothetical protein
MKNNQNTLKKPAYDFPTVNRSLKLMALALLGIFAGHVKSDAQVPAVVGRIVYLNAQKNTFEYLSQSRYSEILNFNKNRYTWDEELVMYLVNKNGVVYAYSSRLRTEYPFNSLYMTNNGISARSWDDHNYLYIFKDAYIDLNDLAVNRAFTAAPIGTLRVTPSNNASEQTKVQWSVE